MRKFLGLVLTGILLFCTIFSIAGCGEENDFIEGSFYSLEEAYENGWLTRKDLESIANYYRINDDVPEESLINTYGEEVVNKIKEAAVECFHTGKAGFEQVEETTINDIIFEEYYGTYNSCIVLKIWIKDLYYPAVEEEIVIDGITFNYTGTFISVWRNE